MIIKEKIKKIIKKNDRIYLMAQCIHNFNNPDFVKLIKGYYEDPHDYVTVLVEHSGIKFHDKIVYHIKIYETVDKKNFKRDGMGFAAALYLSLIDLNFADYFGLTPVVEWGNTATYYDLGMDKITRNVFEYYFESISEINYKEIRECRTIIENGAKNGFFFLKHVNGYATEQDEIRRLGYILKKYIHLNKSAKEYIDDNLKKILGNKKVLAVHARGTDYNLGFANHPKVVTANEYLMKAKDLYIKCKYDEVFLATDDENILTLFKQEFKDKLLYYTDVFRTGNNVGPHGTPNDRPLHYYKLGLEVLRDIYTLANCDSLVCSLSGVSFAARYVNISLDREFKEIVILDNGLNEKDSTEVKKYRREKKKIGNVSHEICQDHKK